MINRFRKKFELVTMACVLFVMIITIAPINSVIMLKTEQNIDYVLNVLAENNGEFPKGFGKVRNVFDDYFGSESIDDEMISDATRYVRYFVIKADRSKKIYDININHIENITEKEARKQGEIVLGLNSVRGYRDYFKYLIKEDAEGFVVVFMDCYKEQQMKMTLLIISCGIAFLCATAVCVLMRFLSNIAIKPFVENLQRQKRFITDASHELKTPLAIISANTEVLELTQGENEWTQSTKNQIKRMDELIKQLLNLAKFSEEGRNLEFTDFSLSDAAYETVKSFETLAESNGKSIESKIEDGISYNGDEKSIRELISILLDNAVKYANNVSVITLSLSKHNKSVRIEICNDCEQLDSESMNRLFDRFYRADSSRTRETGGSGIGLSIAKAIVELHRGKITSKCTDGKRVSFTVTL